MFVPSARLAGALRRILISLTAAAVLGAVIWGASVFMPADKPVGPAQAQAFSWSNRIPLTKAMLAQWLREHGASYQIWARRHPLAAQRLTRTNPATP